MTELTKEAALMEYVHQLEEQVISSGKLNCELMTELLEYKAKENKENEKAF